MPRLSAKTLEKRFPCEQCEKTFRSRAGLLGHIRFKHGVPGKRGAGRQGGDPDVPFLGEGMLVLKAVQGDLPPAKVQEIRRVLTNWIHVRQVIVSFGLRATHEDFKQYVISNVGKVLNHLD